MSDHDEHYIRAVAKAAFRHRDNPIVSKQLDRLITMIKLVEVDSLEEVAGKLRAEDDIGQLDSWSRNWNRIRPKGAPLSKKSVSSVVATQAGAMHMIHAGSGTGKSVLDSLLNDAVELGITLKR